MFFVYSFLLCVLDILTEEAKQISIYHIWLEAQHYAHLETLSITLWILAILGQRCIVSLLTLYVIITVYIKMECPWPKASKCTRAVLNLSWRLFFFFKAKEEIQYVSIFFFHFVCKHICSEAGWGQGWFSSCCPETINEFYFKKNWKPLECMRSFNLLYKMY